MAHVPAPLSALTMSPTTGSTILYNSTKVVIINRSILREFDYEEYAWSINVHRQLVCNDNQYAMFQRSNRVEQEQWSKAFAPIVWSTSKLRFCYVLIRKWSLDPESLGNQILPNQNSAL